MSWEVSSGEKILVSSNEASIVSADDMEISTIRSKSTHLSSAIISLFRPKLEPPLRPSPASSPPIDLCIKGLELELQHEISPVDRDDSDKISFTCSKNDVNHIVSEDAGHQHGGPPDYQHFLGLGNYPVTSNSGTSTSLQQSLFLL